MRILTVRPPWAQLIVNQGKCVENRVRNIAGAYRGPVAIHVGLRQLPAGDRAWHVASAAGMDTDRYAGEPLHCGHIIGVIDLVDVHPARVVTHIATASEPTLEVTCCNSTWAEPSGHHLMLANPRPLSEPIPYTGALGLRRLDAATTAEILAQIGEAR